MTLTRRTMIRLASFGIAFAAILIALAIISTNHMRNYKTQLEAS